MKRLRTVRSKIVLMLLIGLAGILTNAGVSRYTEGIEKFPQDARFYRHRGHRYISIREFDRAIRDFEHAARWQ